MAGCLPGKRSVVEDRSAWVQQKNHKLFLGLLFSTPYDALSISWCRYLASLTDVVVVAHVPICHSEYKVTHHTQLWITLLSLHICVLYTGVQSVVNNLVHAKVSCPLWELLRSLSSLNWESNCSHPVSYFSWKGIDMTTVLMCSRDALGNFSLCPQGLAFASTSKVLPVINTQGLVSGPLWLRGRFPTAACAELCGKSVHIHMYGTSQWCVLWEVPLKVVIFQCIWCLWIGCQREWDYFAEGFMQWFVFLLCWRLYVGLVFLLWFSCPKLFI